jgi:hypothetical protein
MGRCSEVVMVVAIYAVGSAWAHAASALEKWSSTVGMPATIEQIVLPGSELEPVPIDDPDVPIVLRVAGVWQHGTAMRYDLVYYGLEPGTYDLREYLQRKDRSPLGELPEIKVKIIPVLPPGQIQPHELTAEGTPWLGGYRTAITVGFMLWAAGLVTLLMARRRQQRQLQATGRQRVSIADRLRPLVEGAMEGTVSQAELAELERTLIAYWQRRLGLEQERPARVITRLKEDREAGPLIRQLESWLHHPDDAGNVDVAALLAPYQNLPADDLERSVPAEAGAGA